MKIMRQDDQNQTNEQKKTIHNKERNTENSDHRILKNFKVTAHKINDYKQNRTET